MVRQAVRQAHGPEQSRRTHHPEQSRRANHNHQNCPRFAWTLTLRAGSQFQKSKLVLVIKYWNLFVIWCLKFGIFTADSEPQNIEQGISNIEVITSSFCGSLFCCSILSREGWTF
jgi:hypothetical protein